MLPFHEQGPSTATPVIILLHFFGGSHREWDAVVKKLATECRTVVADMPGFGDATGMQGFSVQEMAESIRELVVSFAPSTVVLAGHSMSGKAAMVVAADPPQNLRGLALLAPSPLSGEPMNDQQRADMAIANTARNRAEAFTEAGFYRKPEKDIFKIAVSDVLRSSDEAFHAWPERGTREDWSGRITQLAVPSILIVGEHDKAIAPEVQRRETLPLVEAAGGTLHLLKDAAHLTPYECPDEVARLLKEFCQQIG